MPRVHRRVVSGEFIPAGAAPRMIRRRAPLLADAYTPSEGIMAKVWEFFHPDQVQAEYEAVGKTAPSVDDIRTGAEDAIVNDAADAVRTAAQDAKDALSSFGKWATVGVVVAVLLVIASRARPRAIRSEEQ